jgi:hypothetical protein
MCLIRLELTVAGLGRDALNQYCGRHGLANFPIDVMFADDSEARLQVVPKGDCSCGFVVPRADLDAATCTLRDDARASLAETLASIHQRSPRGIAFTASRVGAPVKHTETVRISHLLSLVRDNRLASYTRYLVNKK